MQEFINKIIEGDTLQVLKQLPDNIIDLSITSPPYNKQEKHKGWLVKNVKYDNYKDVKNEEEYRNEQIEVLNEIFRITKEGGSFFYNHKTRWEKGVMFHPIEWLLKSNWTLRQEIIWDRMIAANIRGWRFWQVDERIYWLYKPINNNKIGEELESRHSLLTSIWRIAPEKNINHPAPFPLALPLRIIHSILNEKDGIVLDPYSGSGTTLLAAKLLNKKYVGIEISKDYIDLSSNRLTNFENDRITAIEETSKHIVVKTFKQRKDNGEYTGRHKKNYGTNKTELNLFNEQNNNKE